MHSILTLLLLLAFAGSAVAADGVLEINQTCAVNTGCFAGDVAGFPVTISAMGSYGLTSNLVVAGASESAIDVNASNVTLDLNGFTVKGPGTCSGGGGTLSCSGSTGTGIDGSDSGAARLGVHSGTVVGFGLGIRTVQESRIREVAVEHNAGDGIRAGPGARIDDCLANENFGDGVEAGFASIVRGCSATGNLLAFRVDQASVVNENVATFSAEQGYMVGVKSKFGRNVSLNNGLDDECGGGICTERRRFYLTKGYYAGDNALTACAAGFHMASFWEIRDTSNLAYDNALGFSHIDSGDGPPAGFSGWIRTGYVSSSTGAGAANCNAWTTAGGSSGGMAIHPNPFWESTSPELTTIAPWRASIILSCSNAITVWCVEDD